VPPKQVTKGIPMIVFARIFKWYEGEFVPYKNETNSPLYFVGGHQKGAPSARLARWLIEFWLKDWKWIIPTGMSAIGLLVAYQSLA
jgi:hypothetical protein